MWLSLWKDKAPYEQIFQQTHVTNSDMKDPVAGLLSQSVFYSLEISYLWGKRNKTLIREGKGIW